MQTFTIIALST